jgi:ribosomal protein L37AE/L43A
MVRGQAGVAMVKPMARYSTHMTVLVDISCPECGETRAVRKVSIGQYKCDECGATFDQTAIDPSGESE